MRNVISAVFDDHAQADRALGKLRSMKINDNHISVVARHGDQATTTTGSGQHVDDHDTKASGAAKGLGIGAGVGALFGLAALAIPGIGPFVAAGALAEVLGTTAGAITAGAVVGGTAGGLSGALMDYGVNRDDAKYYERQINEGGVFIAVDATGSGYDDMEVRRVLETSGGRTKAV